MHKRPVLLVIRDGWGENHEASLDSYNAVKLGKTPVAHELSAYWPRTEIAACGLDVGLPAGVIGNSEVGHQNIGAGRVVDQEIVRIDKVLAEGGLATNFVLQSLFRTRGRLHFMGMLSDAGVHSMNTHLYGLLALAKQAGVQEVFIHVFTDGRDTAPKSGLGFIQALEAKCAQMGIGKIASISGRFWAMDRDERWERVQEAYGALMGESQKQYQSASEAMEDYYKNPMDRTRHGDEFVFPCVISEEGGKPLAPIKEGDAVLFFNFRGDRPRELVQALTQKKFEGFNRGQAKAIFLATLTEYQKGLCEHVVLPKPSKMKGILGETLSQLGIKQFRCAETEKYPHVTFFFNDYREEPFVGEDRLMVSSPRDVPTYDLKPEMSAAGVCAAVKEALLSKKYGFILVNFANADMVGHTGSLDAAIQAVEIVDRCIGELLKVLDEVKGVALITADHGNSDQMWDPSAKIIHTQHTLNPVEAVLYGQGMEGLKLRQAGRLADIAPTILEVMGIEQPEAMTGQSLIEV